MSTAELGTWNILPTHQIIIVDVFRVRVRFSSVLFEMALAGIAR